MSADTYKPNGGELVRAGQVARTEFGSQQLEQRGETAAASISAREQAEVQARFIVAYQRPRDVENFRVRLLKECKRPGFASEAEYSRPVGKQKNEDTGEFEDKIAHGPSIRLIEAAIQHFGNIDAQSPVIYETAEARIVRARMIDLETNSAWSQDIVVPKRVEKRGYKARGGGWDPPKGREVVSQRINSGGDVTFLVTATDAETNNLQSNLISRIQRKNGQRLLPSDIIQEALVACRATMDASDAEDPDAAMRKVIDGFASLNILPEELEAYLGKPLARLQPADLKDLRGVFVSLKGGDISWEEILDAKGVTMGSPDAQKEEARNKLAALGKRGNQTSPTDSKGESGGEASTAKAETSTQTAAPEVEATGKATASPAPELQQHHKAILAYREKIGVIKFNQILGSCGYESTEQIPAAKFADIARELEAELPKPEVAATEPLKRLEFGKSKGGK
jgi:hypothetical protein